MIFFLRQQQIFTKIDPWNKELIEPDMCNIRAEINEESFKTEMTFKEKTIS